MPEYQNNSHRQNVNSTQSFYQAYMNQLDLDYQKKKKHSHRGIVIYLAVITTLFLICFALLAAIIVWHLQNPDVNHLQNGMQTEQPAGEQTNSPMSTAAVAEKVFPSVVFIRAIGDSSGNGGSGFFLSEDGYIATNSHIVRNATEIYVTLYNGEELPATLVGHRPEDDLAVIKVEGNNFPKVSIGDSDAIAAGDVAIAIGHPGGVAGAWSTTQGVISGLNRIVSVEETSYFAEMKMLQTDAHINQGSSGGPLCNAFGEVIGIVTRKSSAHEGIGFAIPINEAMATLNAIIDGKLDGFVSQVSQVRPKIGVSVATIVKGDRFTYDGVAYLAPVDGVFVTAVIADGAADGVLNGGDIIFAINGQSVSNLDELQNVLYKCNIGQKVTFDIYRLNQKMTVEITLGVN